VFFFFYLKDNLSANISEKNSQTLQIHDFNFVWNSIKNPESFLVKYLKFEKKNLEKFVKKS
jgi:hypothetical protein